MRIHNITDRVMKVGGLAIGIGRKGTVSDADFRAWAKTPEGIAMMASGKVQVRADPPPPMTDREAIRRYILSGAVLVMTKDGRPRVDDLSRGMGRPVSGRDRDFAWLQVKAEYRPRRAS